MIMQVVDAHSHIGYYKMIDRKITANELVSLMKKVGIDVSAISQLMDDTKSDNRAVLNAINKYPKQLIGYAHIIPHQEGATAELEKALSQGFKGVKLHPIFDNYFITDEAVREVLAVAEKHMLPTLIHSCSHVSCSPLAIASVAKDFPDLPVIIGHMGLNDVGCLQAIPAARMSDNTYLDTTSFAISTLIENAVRAIGAERIVWGFDAPWLNPIIEMKKIQLLEISNAEKAKILGENAMKLFGL